MSKTRSCRECGALADQDAPFGHCAACLIKLGLGPPPDVDVPLIAWSLFGEYELLEQIGRGGMGVVFKARQVSLKRLVALKMLNPHTSAFPGIAERLRLEAEAAGSLCHPHIVTIYDVGEYEGQPFFTMELIKGSGLDKCIGPDGFRRTISGQETPAGNAALKANIARIMIQIARAVDHAHKHGVLHRDLKPANVLVDDSGEPHLTDFGLAKVIGHTAVSGTASGAIMGTPAYMAPEQASGASKHASTAADIYSFGAIFYAMLTGRPPFRAETPLETLRQVVEDSPKPPSTLNRSVDRDAATICLKCLEKDPQHRYSSALAVAEDLERWSRGEPIEARPVHSLKRVWSWCRREPVVAGLIIGLFLLLTTVAVLAMVLYRHAQASSDKTRREKDDYKAAFLNRIEEEWRQPGRTFVRISDKELAALADRDLATDGTEVRVIIGVIANPRRPGDEVVNKTAPLVNCLQTNTTTHATTSLLFDLIIYTSRSNAVRGFRKGEVDLLLTDPVDYLLIRRQDPTIFPLVKQSYSGRGLHAAIFSRADSGITRLDMLKGKVFAFGEAGSTWGDYLPKAALASAGVRAEDFRRLTNINSTTVATAVKSGTCDAGVADWDDFSRANTEGPKLIFLRELRSPNHPWLARKKFEGIILDELRRRFLSFRDTEALVRLDPKLIGFEQALPTDYDVLDSEYDQATQFDQPR